MSGALVAVLLHPEGLKRLLDRRFLMSLAIAVVIFLPHGSLAPRQCQPSGNPHTEHNGARSAKRRIRETDQGADRILRADPRDHRASRRSLCDHIRQKFLRNLRPTTVWAHFFDTIFLAIGLQVLLLVFAIGITSMRDRWVLPFLFLMPIAFCLKMQARGIRAEDFAKRFFVVPLAVMIVAPSLVFVRANVPTLFGRPEAYNAPYEEFVSKISAEEGKRPGLVLTDGWVVSGNMRLTTCPTFRHYARFSVI